MKKQTNHISMKTTVKELRIGNYIYKCYPDGKEIAIVENISKCFINGFGVSAIEPIPITEDWLFKLGFKSTKNDIPTYYKNFGNLIEYDYEYSFNIYVDLELNYFVTIFGRKIELKYVNQLQNLYYSICREELTIN